MPILIALSLIIQVTLIVHVIKHDRERYWILIILMFPFLGSAFYFFTEVLPDIQSGRLGQRTTRKVLKTIDPQRELKERAKQLAQSDNVHNRVALAEEYYHMGAFPEAIQLYRDSLTGLYQYDPSIMLGLGQALFQNKEYQATKTVLSQLIEHNPDFKSQEGHLLFARTLSALEEYDSALAEYEVLSQYYSGYEAKCRYGLLLRKLGYSERANTVFNDILQRAEHLSRDRKKLQKEWIQIAKEQMS